MHQLVSGFIGYWYQIIVFNKKQIYLILVFFSGRFDFLIRQSGSLPGRRWPCPALGGSNPSRWTTGTGWSWAKCVVKWNRILWLYNIYFCNKHLFLGSTIIIILGLPPHATNSYTGSMTWNDYELWNDHVFLPNIQNGYVERLLSKKQKSMPDMKRCQLNHGLTERSGILYPASSRVSHAAWVLAEMSSGGEVVTTAVFLFRHVSSCAMMIGAHRSVDVLIGDFGMLCDSTWPKEESQHQWWSTLWPRMWYCKWICFFHPQLKLTRPDQGSLQISLPLRFGRKEDGQHGRLCRRGRIFVSVCKRKGYCCFWCVYIEWL